MIFQNILWAQVTVTPSLGWETFVNGITGVTNTLTITDQSYTSVTVDFTGYSGNATFDGTDWVLSYDMGLLNNPSVAVTITADDGTNQYVQNETFTSLAKPAWLVTGSIASVAVAGTVVTFTGTYPITSYSQNIDPSVVGIGGKPLSITGSFIFDGTYDMSNIGSTAAVTSNKVQVDLNLIDLVHPSKVINPTSGVACDFDPNLDLVFVAQGEITTPSLKLNAPRMKFPVVTGVTVGVDAGLTLYATLKGQVVLGAGGFVHSATNGDTKVIAVLTGEGFIRGNIEVLLGLAEASASLNAKAHLGAGLTYTSAGGIGPGLFGGDLEVSGTIAYSAGWGLISGSATKTFYTGSFGNLNDVENAGNIPIGSAVTYDVDGTEVLPDFNPQPSFGTQGDKLYAVWVEHDASTGSLLLSKLNADATGFSPEKIVVSNDYSITNPKVAVLPDSSAIITWSQTRYNNSNISAGDSIEQIINAEDIWVAFYDFASDSIVDSYVLTDVNGGAGNEETGRAEGNAEISVGDNNEAMITWVSKDPNGGSDIYNCHFTKSGNAWTMGNIAPLNNDAGVNYQVHVAYVDASHAIAVWIQDVDKDDETANNELKFAEWNGSSWGSEQILGASTTDIQYKEVSLSSGDGYVGVAYTSTIFPNTDYFENRLDMEVWDEVGQAWVDHFEDSDSSFYFQSPHISISESGKASICYQVVNMFPDSTGADVGELYLYVKDLTNGSSWTEITDGPSVSLICDPNAFVWQLDAGFGGADNFYTLTQEEDASGGTNATNGVRFGNPDYNMVLRGIKVNSNLTVGDISEPTELPQGINKLSINDNMGWFKNYPNPFSSHTTLQFQIKGKSNVQLEVYDITGKLITQLLDANLQQGIYNTEYNASNLPNGFYFAKLTVDNRSVTHKMIIVN